MPESWVFATGFLGFALLGLFHAVILLSAPGRYIPAYEWNRPSLTLVRKTPLELGKRFAGLLLSAMIWWISVRPTVERMLHPLSGEITSGESPLPRGMARGTGWRSHCLE